MRAFIATTWSITLSCRWPFVNEADYDTLDPEDELEIRDLRERLEDGATRIPVYNRTKKTTIETSLELTARERQIVLSGGLLRYVGKESGV